MQIGLNVCHDFHYVKNKSFGHFVDAYELIKIWCLELTSMDLDLLQKYYCCDIYYNNLDFYYSKLVDERSL
jgi:hypothetical protein